MKFLTFLLQLFWSTFLDNEHDIPSLLDELIMFLRIVQYSLKISKKKPITMTPTPMKACHAMTWSFRIQSRSTVIGKVSTVPTLKWIQFRYMIKVEQVSETSI